MQLSPFTERDNIVSNLEEIPMTELDARLQDAVFYLQKLKSCFHDKNNKFILPVSAEIIKKIVLELENGRIHDFPNTICIIITDENIESSDDNILIRTQKTYTALEATVSNIIIVEESCFDDIAAKLPETHVVLRHQNWLELPHAFAHNAYQKNHPFSYKERGKEYNNSFDIVNCLNKYFNEKNWAEEIAWRIDREYQLRRTEGKNTNGGRNVKENYTRVVEELIPQSLDHNTVEDAINLIAEMSFPSILESLTQGIKGRKQKVESTISEGFKQDILEKRKTTLVYQHRMHPDISRFPHEQFYKQKNALLDLELPQPIEDLRKWDYTRYTRRSVWVNVDGEIKGRGNQNPKEVEKMIEELRYFLDFAKSNPQPEGKVWTVACLTFYRGQEKLIREKLQQLLQKENNVSNFDIKDCAHPVNIKLHTVDKFQGHEADIVFLSMVQTTRDGFMDNPNRVNVAITRAKFQLVIIGKQEYYLKKSQSEDLQKLAENNNPFETGRE
jgi:hypothetical protein